MSEGKGLGIKERIALQRSEDNPFNKIFFHPIFIGVLFLLSVFVSVFDFEVAGAIAFLWVIIGALILCEDIFATTPPFLLMCVFLTDCYDSYDTFIKYWWLAIPTVLAIAFHFVFYRRKLVIGETLFGLGAISVSLLLGGLGYIKTEEYFNGTSIYHMIFLGIGMVVAYVLLKPHLTVKRNTDPKEMLIRCFYLMGLFAATLVLIRHISVALPFVEHKPRFQASNNLSTFLMFAMPCPFYMALKKKQWYLHLIAIVFMAAMLFGTGSRGGLVFGIVEFIICLTVFGIFDKRLRYVYFGAGAFVIFAISAYLTYELVLILLNHVFDLDLEVKLSTFLSDDESRVQLLQRLYDRFERYPIFGHGIGYSGNTDFYNPRKGAMSWYHMMIPQIIGSMGIVGILAYGFNFVLRVKAMVLDMVRSKDRSMGLTLSISYIGVLLMSMVNPGLFCPLPYALMAVLIFALLDGTIKGSKLKE